MRKPRRRPYTANYPAHATDVIDQNAKYKGATLKAVKAFRRSKPWRGTLAEQQAKFCALNRALARAYKMRIPRLVFQNGSGSSSCSSYRLSTHTITLVGKLSVVTFLHEFGHARGFDERDTCYWSINLFRRCFPRSFARCRFEGHMVVRDR